MNFKERLTILDELNCVDEVVEQASLDPTENLKILHNRFPKAKLILFQGHQNWVGLPGTDYIESIDGEIYKPEYYSRITRSSIKNELNKTEIEQPNDIESYLLGNISYFPLYNSTKANTLASLKHNLNKLSIEELFIFTKRQWVENKKDILLEINRRFNAKIVVRSSSRIEDSITSSFAGYFHSELNIDPNDYKQLESAIKNVINSYLKHENNSENDQVLIQSQTEDVAISGVVFTRNIGNNSPYYFINYDESSSTDSVTSGMVGDKIEIIRNVDINILKHPWGNLIKSIKEIELSLHNLALDIEFAIKNDGKVIIFQVRPIAALQKYINVPTEAIYSEVEGCSREYKRLSKRSLFKNSYTLSDMSFWNPAEIIGDRADNLAYSIYRYLILHKSWNTGLVPLGYRKIDRSIMVRIGNKPYIEVETAFTSLLPSDLDNKISEKLISYYVKKLKKFPEYHDKIEFEIVNNCFTPKTDEQLKEIKSVLTRQEHNQLRDSLLSLTQNIFDNYEIFKQDDLNDLNKLSKRRVKRIKTSNNSSHKDKLLTAVGLLNDAKELCTPQFSRMARLSFIGNQYLKGLVEKGVISKHDCDIYLMGIDTVASEIVDNFDNVISGKMSITQFNNQYGHLRPGTYDITKLPYFKDTSYFSTNIPVKLQNKENRSETIDFNNFHQRIAGFLKTFDVAISADRLLKFVEETIKYRESFKFEFTKNISIALELLVDVGESIGFTRDMMSNLSIECILGIQSTSGLSEIFDLWITQISGKKKINEINKYLSLPSLIFSADDLKIVRSYSIRPNFITNLIVKEELVDLDLLKNTDYGKVSGMIVLLEKADPGYDWIFSKHIKGLITKFGGAASHMAIRCAEFGIPAAIGCGDAIYNDLKTKNIIELNCMEKTIKY